MAIITQNRLWNKIQTKQEVNTETGEIEVFAIGSGLFGVDVLIASSEGKGSDWKLNNPQSFTDVYNRRNNTGSSVKEERKDLTDKADPIREHDCIWCMACVSVCPPQAIKVDQSNLEAHEKAAGTYVKMEAGSANPHAHD